MIYALQNNILYRNKVKICENVNGLLITADDANNTVKIQMTIGDYKKDSQRTVMLGFCLQV